MHWNTLHEKALSLAKEFKKAQAELLDILQAIDSQRVFLKLGYGSLWDYCLRGLKLSETDAESFIRVARKAKSIPELKEAVQQGEINLSAARRVCSVITPENKDQWLDLARTLPQRELEKEIVKENPKAKVPDKIKPLAPKLTELHCSVSVEVEALIRKVQDLESKRQKKNCSLEDVLKQMALLYLDKNDPVQKAERSTSKPRVNSNSQVLRRIPNQVRHEVARRDQGKCVFVDSRGHRCNQSRFTEAHHIRPYSIGGKHEAGNLATLCATHHKAIHEGTTQFRLGIG